MRLIKQSILRKEVNMNNKKEKQKKKLNNVFRFLLTTVICLSNLFCTTVSAKDCDTVSGNGTRTALELIVYADYVRTPVSGQNSYKNYAVLYVTVRADKTTPLNVDSLRIYRKEKDGSYTNDTDAFDIKLSESGDILVATMIISENGDYLVEAYGLEGDCQRQTIRIRINQVLLKEEEKEMEEKKADAEAVDLRRQEKQTEYKDGQREKMSSTQSETNKLKEVQTAKAENADSENGDSGKERNVRIVAEKKETDAVIRKEKTASEKEQSLPENGNMIQGEETNGEIESPVRKRKEEAEENVTEGETVPEKQEEETEDIVKRRNDRRMMQAVKIGVPISAFLLLLAASVLLYRRKNIVALYAAKKKGEERKLGELMLCRKENQHTLEIPSELLFAGEEGSYCIRIGHIFDWLHHDEKLYISCLDQSFEVRIHRQITFSV